MIQPSMQIDDLWLASYLVTQGAELAGVQVLPYSNGPRMRAVFVLECVSAGQIESYANGDPSVAIHRLRTAMNELRDRMYAALEQRNGNRGIKQMPNGKNGNGQRRRGDNENRAEHHR